MNNKNQTNKNEIILESLEKEKIKNKKIEEIKEKLNLITLEEEIKLHKKKIKDIQLRSQAEIENIRRRTTIDIEKAYKFSLERFANDLLPVIDNLERAIELIDKSKNEDSTTITEGIKLTFKLLINTIKKFGIKIINDINVPFNPDIHQAISTIDSKDTSNNIINIVQKGYTLNNRLLRPAMVIVSKKI